jgi:uncharacterized protein (TIGR03083 family)
VQAGEHYRAQRARLTQLVGGFDEQQLSTPVPSCPGWTVHALLSHLTGVTADLTAGRIEGAGSPPWTAKQIADRQGVPLADLLAEWAECGPKVEESLDLFGAAGWRLVYDITMHEDDAREALGLPPGSSPTHDTVLDGLAQRAGQKITEAALPALRLTTTGQEWVLGEGEPAATLSVPDRGELQRVLGGRRSHEAMRALDWAGDAEPYLQHLTLFPPP